MFFIQVISPSKGDAIEFISKKFNRKSMSRNYSHPLVFKFCSNRIENYFISSCSKAFAFRGKLCCNIPV